MGICKLRATEIGFDSISKQYTNIGYKDIKVTVAFSKADGNNSFAPGRDITRAEFAAIIVRALGLNASGSVSFTDIKSAAGTTAQ